MAIPRATARLQLHQQFTFDDAVRVVPYYAALGISHIYASPILTARPGSTHGYDIVDPTRINPELGGEAGLRRLVASLRAADMGLILDIVPNHMGIGAHNPWWQHVLEWGQASPYARWFDIDWQPADETLHGKVMAPFLGQPYGDALGSGQIKLQFDAQRGKFHVSYYAHRFPVSPADYASILQAAGSDHLALAIAAFEADGAKGEGSHERNHISQQSADLGCGVLRDLGASSDGMAAIAAVLTQFLPDTPAGFDRLHRLLERQHYRLAWWRCAADGINWRRFFEVTDLAGVRVEQDDVFEATHALIFRLYTEGLIDGVRIDHVDGLADPGAYCRKLRRRLQALSAQRPPELPPAPAYLIVEKILGAQEALRSNWDIDGTSGYDFMDQVGAVLHDAAGEAPLTALWSAVSGQEQDFLAEVQQARRQLLANNLAGEFEAAARALHALARTDLRTRDYSLGAIRRVFTELLMHFPVYRTYADSNGRDELDQQIIDGALERATATVERTERGLLDVIGRWLGGDAPRDAANPRVRQLHQAAITRFQQLTPPLAAKSVEDTAFYRYGRLLSRNEVGSDPGQFALSVQQFHQANQVRAQQFPHSLLATATHDHKRGEDVRARLAVLSEAPQQWSEMVREWMQLNAALRIDMPSDDAAPSVTAPHPADELMLYQMLVGAWPIGLVSTDAEGVAQLAERLDRWQTKALREAKQVSDWVLPNEHYEAACKKFLESILDPRPGNAFLTSLAGWIKRITPAGVVNSLAQAVLRMTVPGIPDMYQGTDLWDFSMVDPDNRRPVDYAARIGMLEQALPNGRMKDWQTGHLKQSIIQQTLLLRRKDPDLFLQGDYLALEIDGPLAAHAIAFARRCQDRTAIVIVTHLPYRLLAEEGLPVVAAQAWEDTAVNLPAGWGPHWQDIHSGTKMELTGRRLLLREAISLLPVAVLENPMLSARPLE